MPPERRDTRMPASAIAELPIVHRPDSRSDAARSRASDDGFGAALDTATLPRTPKLPQPSPAATASGGSPAVRATARTIPSAGSRPATPASEGPATADETAAGPVPKPGQTAIPPAGAAAAIATPDPAEPGPLLATDAATSGTADVPALVPQGMNAATITVAGLLPARHGTDSAPSRHAADSDPAAQAAVQVVAGDPAPAPPPVFPPAASLPDAAQAGPSAGRTTDTAVAAGSMAGPDTTAPAMAEASVAADAPADAAAAPASPAAPSTVPSGSVRGTLLPDTSAARPDVAAALHAATDAAQPWPGRSATVPVPASSAAGPRGGATQPASVPSASSQPASPSITPAQAASSQPAGTGHAGPDASLTARHALADPGASVTPATDVATQPAPGQADAFQMAAQGPAQASTLLTAQPGSPAIPAAAPAPAASPAVSAEPAASPAAQVVPAVLAMHSANGAQNMMLRLTPAELGTVQVQITRDHDGAASVSVLVERPETLRLLLHDQAQLQHALTQAGLPQDRTLSLQQAPAGSFVSQDHNASARDPGQNTGQGAGDAGGEPGQAGRDSGARQNADQGQSTRSGSGRAVSALQSYASAWQPAGIDITA